MCRRARYAPGHRVGRRGRGTAPRGCHVVHIDVDPSVIAGNPLATRGYPVTFIPADIEEFLEALERFEWADASPPVSQQSGVAA